MNKYNQRIFNGLRDVLRVANGTRRHSYTLLFALLCAGQIDYITLRAFVDLDTEIIENYWGCILRQLASIKVSVQVNFYLTKIRADPYKNN